MTNKIKIKIPDPKRSSGLVMVRGKYHARYYSGDRELRKSTGTSDFTEAKEFQKKFYGDSKIYSGRTILEKIKRKATMYIYKRPPYSVVVEQQLVGFAETEAEAYLMRDRYVAENY